MGLARPATLFADPAKQAALEKALKECGAKVGADSSSSSGKRKHDGSAEQPWLRNVRCRHCHEKGHFARDCPNGGATQKGPRPPA